MRLNILFVAGIWILLPNSGESGNFLAAIGRKLGLFGIGRNAGGGRGHRGIMMGSVYGAGLGGGYGVRPNIGGHGGQPGVQSGGYRGQSVVAPMRVQTFVPASQVGVPRVQSGPPRVQSGTPRGQNGPPMGQNGLPRGQSGPPRGQSGPPRGQVPRPRRPSPTAAPAQSRASSSRPAFRPRAHRRRG